MGSIGDPFTQTVPPVGTAGTAYATTIDAILTEVMLRLSTKVPLSSLSLSADLNFTGAALLNAAYITLSNSASVAASPVNRISAFSGDLYWTSPTGSVQITTGNLLNAAAVGGITGAYGGANPAQFRFDNVASRYDAYSNFAGNALGFVRATGFDVSASTSPASPFARIAFGGVANRTYTLPTVPATSQDRPLYMTSTGQITTGHASRNYIYSALGATTVATVGNSSIVVNATGNGLVTAVNGGTQTAYCPVPALPEGFRITSFSVMFAKLASAGTACSFDLLRTDLGSPGTPTTLASGSSTVLGNQNPANALGVAETVAVNKSYNVRFNFSTVVAGAEQFFGFTITGDMPA